MDTLATVVGLGIFCFILLYIAFNLDKEHIFFKIFIILLVIFSLNLVAKASIDNYSVCDTYLLNSTGHDTSTIYYTYNQYCPLENFTTPSSILRLSNLLTWGISIYLLLFTLWTATNGFKDTGKYVQMMFRGKK
jgi:hypothetical protein